MNLDASKAKVKSRDEALAELYDVLVARNAPKPGSFSSLSAEGQREYFRLSRQRSRARHNQAQAVGAFEPSLGNVRDALADAALMILAVDAPGADLVREVLAQVFSQRPGVPLTIQQKARSGKLRPKLAKPAAKGEGAR